MGNQYKKKNRILKDGQLICLLLISILGHSQNPASIKGTIVNQADLPISDAVVSLQDVQNLSNEILHAVTDSRGHFQFSRLQITKYTISVDHIRYKTFVDTLILSNGQSNITIKITEKTHVLRDLNIVGKSETQKAGEQSIKALVVNAKEVNLQPVSLTELINRSPGVRIRQTGGLGSPTEISINGFQGRSIRYFRDGIPIDYLRDGYNLATVPVNMLDRIEIYKGVLPVSLGADALGGAVNLISRTSVRPFLDATLEIASFNTRRVTLNAQYTDPEGSWFAGTQAFFNRSDNDYEALLKVTDPITKNQKYERLRLFHNGFSSSYAELYGGLSNKRWADELKLSLAAFHLTRQQQHPALMTDPYGAVSGKQESIVPSLSYKKTWLDERLSVNHFMVFNTITLHRIDTLRGQYDWYGHFTPSDWKLGESRQAALSEVNVNNFIARSHFIYTLHPSHTVELNHVYSSSTRTGRDPYGIRFEGTDTDVLSVPARYQKQIITTGLESTFGEKRFTNNLIAKFYRFRSKGTETWASRPIAQHEEVSQSGRYWGLAEALKFQITPESFARISTELASRLPEQDELFGDAMWIVPGFNLRPERSMNLNLGYRISVYRHYSFEINGFYRRTTGMILLVPTQAPYAQYQNMENVKGHGIEADGQVLFAKRFTFNANVTWQNIRLFGLESIQDRWKNGARLRNTPYFFANAGLSGSFRHIFKKDDYFSSYIHLNFIREYYLETIPKSTEPRELFGLAGKAQIQSDLVIPTQHLLSAGINYCPRNQSYTLAMEIKNVLNSDLYDYFRVQKAGRSIHLKVGFLIKASNKVTK